MSHSNDFGCFCHVWYGIDPVAEKFCRIASYVIGIKYLNFYTKMTVEGKFAAGK